MAGACSPGHRKRGGRGPGWHLPGALHPPTHRRCALPGMSGRAPGAERAHGSRGLRPRRGLRPNNVRQRLRPCGSRPQLPTRVWQTSKWHGRPMTRTVPRVQAEWTFARFPRQCCRGVGQWECVAACVNVFLAGVMSPLWSHRLRVG
jgi:hypothetical protein